MPAEKDILLREKYKNLKGKSFYKDLKRIESGEPLAYVIGNIPFLDCIIDLSYKPLIPRVETEFWLNEVLKSIPKTKNIKILDVFSGSGCIGVAVAKQIPKAHITFSDIEQKSIKQIKINTKLNNIENKRIKIIRSDVFSKINDRYDYVFANPPYVSKRKNSRIEKSVLEWEPHEALFCKDNGLFYIKKLIKNRKNVLNKNGVMYIEIDDCQKNSLSKLLKKYGVRYRFLKDQYKKWRVLEIS